MQIVHADDVIANLIVVGRDPLLQKSQVRGLLWQWMVSMRCRRKYGCCWWLLVRSSQAWLEEFFLSVVLRRGRGSVSGPPLLVAGRGTKLEE